MAAIECWLADRRPEHSSKAVSFVGVKELAHESWGQGAEAVNLVSALLLRLRVDPAEFKLGRKFAFCKLSAHIIQL